ncbi:MAG: 50S ribosomal protein L9 [Rhodospirillaceae bacterium]|nr:50S ribosomal protein L9 [Rhodospirillaceae bacterium]
MEVILLERIEKLGQMGDVVNVKPGYARNFLLPKHKALRANEENRKQFEVQRAQLEAANLEQRGEAEKVAEKMQDLSVILVRQAGEAGQLYGSVSARDISTQVTEAGFTIGRQQVDLANPIKSIGLFDVTVSLHPEVSVTVIVNVARSPDEAKTQARTGKAVSNRDEEDDEAAARAAAIEAAEDVFEKNEDAEAAIVAGEESAAVEEAAPVRQWPDAKAPGDVEMGVSGEEETD